MRPIFLVSALTDRCLQTLIFISAGERERREKQELLKYFKNNTACLNTAKPLKKQSTLGSVSFIALCSWVDPTRRSSGKVIGKVTWSLQDRRVTLACTFPSAEQWAKKKTSPICAHLQVLAAVKTEGWRQSSYCSKIFVSCKLTASTARQWQAVVEVWQGRRLPPKWGLKQWSSAVVCACICVSCVYQGPSEHIFVCLCLSSLHVSRGWAETVSEQKPSQ